MKSFLCFVLVALGCALAAPVAQACPWCRKEVQEAVYGPDFFGTALVLLAPLLVIALVGVGLHFSDGRGLAPTEP